MTRFLAALPLFRLPLAGPARMASFALLSVLGVGACAQSYPPGEAALAALQSDERVTVEEGEWITFTPAAGAPAEGWIFYPGGAVSPQAYAPLWRRMAEAGALAVIVPMPLDLAIFAPLAADDVVAAHPDIARWGIAGHSLGGVAAAEYVHERPDVAGALALYASYPQDKHDLSGRDLPVLSLVGDQDRVLNQETYERTRALLPADTRFAVLEGGNHAQFGDYGPQDKDGEATMSPEEQWAQTLALTRALWEGGPAE